MPGGDVVSDAINPGAQRTSLVEGGEAAPELKMNFLQQVATRLGIQLVSPRQPVECGAVGVGGLFVKRILAHVFNRSGFNCLHI